MAKIKIPSKVNGLVSSSPTGETIPKQLTGVVSNVLAYTKGATEYVTDGSVSLLNISKNDIIVMSGFTNIVNNGSFKVKKVEGSSLFLVNINGVVDTSGCDIFFSSGPPILTVTAVPPFGLREFGDDVINPVITANVQQGANSTATITLLRWLRNGGVRQDLTPPVNYLTNYSFNDTFVVSANATYRTAVTCSDTKWDRNNTGSTTSFS